METTENNVIEPKIIVITKIPEYIKKAQHAYYNRNKLDPEYSKMKKENTMKWRVENREKYNLSQKLRREKKKEELKIQQTNTSAIIETQEISSIEIPEIIDEIIEPLNVLGM